jgi:predicted MFS family arabinose efflux permease
LVAESPVVLGRLWRTPALRTNLLLAVFAAGAVMMYMPNSYGLALEVFHRGSLGLAALEVFVSAGLIAGGLIFSRMPLRGDKNAYVFCSLAAMAACLMGVSFSGLFWVSIFLMGIGGVANVGVFVPSITMFQETPPTPDKGRLISLRSGFGQLGVAAGLVVGGLLGAKIGIKPAFFVAGAATIVIGLVIYVPYRLGASRRAATAWEAATQAGANRSTARQQAQEAAYNGIATTGGGLGATGAGTTAWTAAAEAATVTDDALALEEV